MQGIVTTDSPAPGLGERDEGRGGEVEGGVENGSGRRAALSKGLKSAKVMRACGSIELNLTPRAPKFAEQPCDEQIVDAFGLEALDGDVVASVIVSLGNVSVRNEHIVMAYLVMACIVMAECLPAPSILCLRPQ